MMVLSDSINCVMVDLYGVIFLGLLFDFDLWYSWIYLILEFYWIYLFGFFFENIIIIFIENFVVVNFFVFIVKRY